MKIACIGWGSLIWDRQDLLVRDEWFEDGPVLPIEFTRQSRNGRITLIIDDLGTPVTTLWSLMTTDVFDDAKESLMVREDTTKSKIHSVKSTDNESTLGPYQITVLRWLQEKQLDAAVWTGLSFSEHTNWTRPSLEYVIKYLTSLEGEVGRLAEEYVRRAPKQIDTEYRREIEKKLGWTYLPD